MKSPILTAGLILACGAAFSQDKPVLTVMTYDSFVAEWGPGPLVEAAFEETCDCDLQFVAPGDAAAMLARLRLEGSRSEADVVLGLDTNLIGQAKASGLFTPHGQSGVSDVPNGWADDTFLPFDWGYFSFVYDTSRVDSAPTSFAKLAASDISIVIQDPRSSSPGLGLLLWVKSVYGDRASEIWEALSDNIVTVTPGWSEAYFNIFLGGEADMVLSYTTSPSYHVIVEEDQSKVAAIFDEGHYMQIEVAGKVAGTDQPELADAFLAFMSTDAFQSVIPTTNWMFPAHTPAGGLPDGFASPLPADQSLILSVEEAASVRDSALAEWQNALAK